MPSRSALASQLGLKPLTATPGDGIRANPLPGLAYETSIGGSGPSVEGQRLNVACDENVVQGQSAGVVAKQQARILVVPERLPLR